MFETVDVVVCVKMWGGNGESGVLWTNVNSKAPMRDRRFFCANRAQMCTAESFNKLNVRSSKRTCGSAYCNDHHHFLFLEKRLCGVDTV